MEAAPAFSVGATHLSFPPGEVSSIQSLTTPRRLTLGPIGSIRQDQAKLITLLLGALFILFGASGGAWGTVDYI